MQRAAVPYLAEFTRGHIGEFQKHAVEAALRLEAAVKRHRGYRQIGLRQQLARLIDTQRIYKFRESYAETVAHNVR